MLKKTVEGLVMLLFLVPLFYINIRISHDWGDDFAQYIHQAKNITQGVSQNETGYVFNPERDVIGPKAYPTGFPLLLALLVNRYGINFTVFNYANSFYLLVASLFGFLFLRKRFSFLVCFFTVLIMTYSGSYINFKMEVFSDIPFNCFFLIAIYFIACKKTYFNTIVLGLLLAFLSHIRSVGLLVIAVHVLTQLFYYNSVRNASFRLHQKTISTVISFLLLYIVLKIAFPCNTNYPLVFVDADFWERSFDHFSHNALSLAFFFNIYEPRPYCFISVVSSASIVVFSILGFLYEVKEHKFNFVNSFVLIYIITIATFKFGNSGIRFFIPLLIFCFYYSIIALKKVLIPLQVNYKLVTIVMGMLALYPSKLLIETALKNQNVIIDGPCTPASYGMFKFINATVPQGKVVVFEKPRALALFTNVQSVALRNDLSIVNLKKQLRQYNASYLLLNKSLYNEALSNYTQADTINCRLIFANADYQFFEFNTSRFH